MLGAATVAPVSGVTLPDQEFPVLLGFHSSICASEPVSLEKASLVTVVMTDIVDSTRLRALHEEQMSPIWLSTMGAASVRAGRGESGRS